MKQTIKLANGILCPCCLSYTSKIIICSECGLALCNVCSVSFFNDYFCKDCTINSVFLKLREVHPCEHTASC